MGLSPWEHGLQVQSLQLISMAKNGHFWGFWQFKGRRGNPDFNLNHDESETLAPNKTRWIRFCGQISRKYVKIWGSRQNREFSKIVDIFGTKLGLEI